MTVNTRFGQYWQMTIKIWQLVGHKILFTITRTEVFIGSLYTNCRRASRTLLFDLRDGKYELTTQYWNCVSIVSHSCTSIRVFLHRIRLTRHNYYCNSNSIRHLWHPLQLYCTNVKESHQIMYTTTRICYKYNSCVDLSFTKQINSFITNISHKATS